MKREIFLAFTLFFLCGAVPSTHAQAPSLFFTQDQRAQIDEEVRKTPPDIAARARHLLHLSSIMYFGADNWTLWLQGKRWTPSTTDPNVTIRSVTPTDVRLSVKLQNGAILDSVLLRPHQSLNLLNGEVMEGL